MALKLLSLAPSPHSSPLRNPNLTAPSISNRRFPLRFFPPSSLPRRNSRSAFCRIDFVTPRAFQSQELTEFAEEEEEEEEEEERTATQSEKKDLAKQGIWSQIKEIVMFTGPATGLWICGPLMSLIDTAVIGQRSSIELAALGPATVVCDYMSYAFMFLSIATSNMVATALAKQDREEVQHHISVLLLIGLTCGFGMLLFSKLFGAAIITAFTGPKNVHVVPAASAYVQIRGLAWPALLVGWVAQSASLGMKDSWGPLKALAAASILNLTGCLLLCTYLGYGIVGAAWATMISQVVAAYMMIQTLNRKGYNAFAFSIPSGKELLSILGLAAPVFMTLMSKVGFYSLLIYFATSMGTHTMAAHQVMVQTFCMCTVWGEPLSQTAQSFMPELIYGVNRSYSKARLLLRSLLTIGAILGLFLGIVGTSVPWLFPYIFTPDQMVIQEMHKVMIPYFIALAITPPTHSLEGTLLVLPSGGNPMRMHQDLNMRHLIMKTALHENEFVGIAFMLNSCSMLQCLTIELCKKKLLFEYEAPFDFDRAKFWIDSVGDYTCLNSSLKVVEFNGFKGTKNEVLVLKYLIKWGKVLERMSITLWKGFDESDSDSDVEEIESCRREKAEMLLMAPKASSKLEISIF